MSATHPGPVHGRRAAGLVFGLFVAVGLVVLFGGALARSTEVESQAARASAEVERRLERVAAGEAEIEFIQGDDFLRQQARREGFGEAGETRFGLPPGAPSPPPVVPIGSRSGDTGRRAPFDAWMELLFGS